MQYLLMIWNDEAAWTDIPEEEQNKIFAEYMEFTRGIKASGNYIGGEALQPGSTATRVQSKNGKIVTTDGPFVETKEQIGGYYLIEAKDLDEAVAIAARLPDARYGGTIEVRPVMETPKD